MRGVSVLLRLVLVLAALPATGASFQRHLVGVETLVGAWNGRWVADGGRLHGPMELVVARAPGREDVVGHFAFMTGARTRSMRYEARGTLPASQGVIELERVR
jgi:hypothetical protein